MTPGFLPGARTPSGRGRKVSEGSSSLCGVDGYDDTFEDDLEPGQGLIEQDGPGLFDATATSDQGAEAAEAAEVALPSTPVATDHAPVPTAGRVNAPPPPPLALYRRYRPDRFSEVIGQEHVTEPLMRALENNRVNHAYLFSGPRGCGKTTSARILARALNCEKGPTPDPCGECQSCRDLARGGGGSIDVIEIDAASHGGVDDARDLRERAFFSPVSSRYKIYIVDEAHMVTTAGFNAMLKLVEEPPPHVKFIFATTEPEKVIGTIRSRTHHYPFRLVPPKVLTGYLGELCEREGVPVEGSVLPLVVRAGGGSVRDSLSVLDQLLGGAGPDGVTYQQASGLLGYTPDALLDAIMDAFAAGDSAGVFSTIDRVIEVGQDPRRFAEDLLRRLRDLVIVAAVPNALSSGLIDVASDQAERLQTQAAGMGAGELARAAEVIATGLTDMRGTTAPRLHLELMCARVLLPGADVDARGIHARLDRLERRVAAASGATGPAAEPPARPPEWTDAPVSRPAKPDDGARVIPIDRARQRPAPEPTPPTPAGAPTSSAGSAESTAPPAAQRPATGQRPAGQRPPSAPAGGGDRSAAPTAVPAPPAREPSPGGTAMSAADLRREWPRVLEAVKSRRRFAWILLSQNAQVVDLADGVLTLGFGSPGARDNFAGGGSIDVLRDCLVETLMLDVRIDPVVTGTPPASARPTEPTSSEEPRRDSTWSRQARENIRPTGGPTPPPAAGAGDEYGVSTDDVALDEAGESATELIARHLGAEPIDDDT